MNLCRKVLLFWDFDGVIKDSVDVKTRAFVNLFRANGPEFAEKVRVHHENNGGMSRFEKIPIYLRWAGEEPSTELVREYCDQFSVEVLRGVIDSPWVPGVERFLRTNPYHQTFVIVSATPQAELHQILTALALRECFADVFGAPTRKAAAIRLTLDERRLGAEECLMIGDAVEDLQAADENGVPFLLRRHSTNAGLFVAYGGVTMNDFRNL